MSRRLTSRSEDLLRLETEGYELEELDGHLVVGHVPFVTPDRTVAYGKLITRLELAGDRTVKPTDHVAYFMGGVPCDKLGVQLHKLINNPCAQALTATLTADCSFSSKPVEGYANYFDKMTRYIEIVSNEARAIDPTATACTHRVILDLEGASVFHYIDTASARAGISRIASKFAGESVGIVGLGGTGSYILDQVAKTPVDCIHLFDGDDFLQHNAFRAPGAPTVDELGRVQPKVDYWSALYGRMHKHIVGHNVYVDDSNAEALLGQLTFVFLALDASSAKRPIIDALERAGVPFIDCGLGIYDVDGRLAGVARVTTSSPTCRDRARSRIPLDDEGNDLYATNIQVADLNSLNATLAVIRWKKLVGFYNDLSSEHHSTYSIDVDEVTNEDVA